MGDDKKSGRTPEQQAARDARKAAKAAAAAAVNADSTNNETTDTPTTGEDGAGPSKKSKFNEETYEIDINAPTPLSKAELRAAKRKAKRGEEVDETEKPKKRKKLPEFDPLEADPESLAQKRDEAKGKRGVERPAKVKKQNSVWIGNLAFKTTDEQLQGWLEKGVQELGGEAGGVTRVNLPKTPGRGGYSQSKGYAYVDFATPELQALAVGLSERLLDGRKLLIKLGSDHSASESARTPKPAAVKSFAGKQPNPESATLFVGNLPFDATEEGLRDLIESNAPSKVKKVDKVKEEGAASDDEGGDGEKDEEKEDGDDEDKEEEVADEDKEEQAYRGGRRSGLRKVRLGAFEDTGKCKGFAFLDFLEPKHATAALNTRANHFYGARKLTLQYASEAAAKRSGGKKNHAAFAEEKPVRKPRVDRGERGERPARKWGAPAAAAAGAGGEEAEYETKATGSFDQAALARQVLGAGGYGNGRDDDGAGGAEERPKRTGDKRGKKWETSGRPRPGAALAMAKRENVAIVAPQGQKISFD